MLRSVLCITTNKYLVHVHFSIVGLIPLLLAGCYFFPYIGSATALPDMYTQCMFVTLSTDTQQNKR